VAAHPVARRRNPRRVPDDLARLALADVDGIVLHPDADVPRLHLAPVLPEREAERGDVERELDVGLAGLELALLDPPAGQLVGALRLEAVVAYEVLLLLLRVGRARRQSQRERRQRGP
jgi:hypothetical protein